MMSNVGSSGTCRTAGKKGPLKNLFCVLALSVLLLVTGCATMMIDEAKLVADELSPEYVQQTYGQRTQNLAYFMAAREFENQKLQLRASVIDDDKLSEDERRAAVATLDGMTWEKRRYLVYFFRLRQPTLPENARLQLSLTDNGGASLIDFVYPFRNDVTVTYTDNVSSNSLISYNYAWLMRLKTPMTADQVGKEPRDLVVTYPNGQKAVFRIQP